ncbi:oxalate decarboxylase [Nitrospirillum amazonense]|uniref:Oxalate decarboxylase n=1 Tax=Nitrospirillum amazonense TaxID=28077 RepID=A0A560ESA4_9PROT|nr:cupin domain-containing protein [Nitrospirillum amazonense]TWB12251.1 oxalate decarboxylase [Nitrospirillum amazonense]
MTDFTRRNIIAAGAVAAAAAAANTAGAATFGNPDRPAQGRVNLSNPIAGQEPGPQNPALANQFPSFQDPPATDVAGMDLFWASFNNAHKRIQDGGWAREVTQADFAISEAVSGVNMRLGPGGVRELHWHQQAEWAVMTDGTCRITVIDADGRPAVRDVKEGDLWYFPPGLPHSLQGIGTSGAEFTLVFDNGRASEFNTLLLTEWMAHTPPEVLAENFGLPQSAFKNIPVDDLWIYQAKDPIPPLEEVQKAVRSPDGEPEFEFTFSMGTMKPTRITKGGSVKVVDTRNFPVSKTIAAALVTIKPGGLRELHWHPNADEWQYYLKGQGRMTVFNTGPRAQTADFRPGDLGYVKKSFGHYVQNTGTEDLVFLEIFKADRFQEVSLAQWLACTPPELVAQHTNMDPNLIRQFNKARWDILPA